MNTDIRLSVNFWEHHKTIKLKRRLGASGPEHLIRIWCYAAEHRTDGILNHMDCEDIAIVARFDGDADEFVAVLTDLRWLDQRGDGTYVIHDWEDHNSWAAKADDRSDQGRFARMAKTHPVIYESLKSQGFTSISKRSYEELTSGHQATVKEPLTTTQGNLNGSLTPAPAPAPSPSPKEKTKKISASEPTDAALAQPAASAAMVEPTNEPQAIAAQDEQPGPPGEHNGESHEPQTDYKTKRKRRLNGRKLDGFERFWEAFDYKSGKAEAADAWLDIPNLTDELQGEIIAAARREKMRRAAILRAGGIPKMAQGWLSGRRWEDVYPEGPDAEYQDLLDQPANPDPWGFAELEASRAKT